MNKVRIRYWYHNQWCLSGMMLLHDAINMLDLYMKKYGKAEIKNFGEQD